MIFLFALCVEYSVKKKKKKDFSRDSVIECLLSPAGLTPSLAGPVQVVDSPLLRQQVQAQRLGIKHLKNENNRLKVSC